MTNKDSLKYDDVKPYIEETYAKIVKNENIKYISYKRVVFAMNKEDYPIYELYTGILSRYVSVYLQRKEESGELKLNVIRQHRKIYEIVRRGEK